MPANFQVKGSDLGDLFIPRDLFTQGGLWLWGVNGSGQLGDNTTTNRSSPVQTVAGGINWKQVACGFRSGRTESAGIKTDGTLWVWGSNYFGGVGDNTTTSRSSPVQTVSAGTNWKLVACGGYFGTTAAIKTDGTLWMWGGNIHGQLGDNTTTSRSSPVQTVSAGANWKQVSIGRFHTAAVKTDGTLWAWGRNHRGQLGTNDLINVSSPVQTVSAGTNWKLVSCGGYDGSTAAVKTDGTLWVWGYNGYAELGTNDSTNRSSPVQTIAAGTNWKKVAVGGYHNMAAIKTDGTLWLWGNNGSGQLGTNDTTSRGSPVQTVSAGTNWKDVSQGNGFTIAVKTDGTLWLWGYNDFGQLGTNDITSRSSPVQTVAGGTNWKAVGVLGGSNAGAAITDIY